MTKETNKELLVLNRINEVGVAKGYNSAVNAAKSNQVAIATGAYSVASVSDKGSMAIAIGLYAAATALCEDSAAVGWGSSTKVKGVLNSIIVAAAINPEGRLSFQQRKVDGVSIMPDTWYSLVDGELRKIE